MVEHIRFDDITDFKKYIWQLIVNNVDFSTGNIENPFVIIYHNPVS